MDDIDRRIVALLRENARRSFKDIGNHVHLTAPAVKRRVDRLEADGVLLGYTAIVDPPASAGTPRRSSTSTATAACPARRSSGSSRRSRAWSSAHTVAGEASAMIHVRASDTKDLEDTLERIRSTDGITRTVTEVVLSTLLRR